MAGLSHQLQLQDYKKFLLTRVSVNDHFKRYLEKLQAQNDPSKNYTFHKIIVHKWPGSSEDLFVAIKFHFKVDVLPVQYENQGEICTFYTSDLFVVISIARFDFMFPFRNSMFSVDIVFNDKGSVDLFGENVSLDDVVNSVVCKRFTDKCELDLTDFCNDIEFVSKKIHFHNISLLGSFMKLMEKIAKNVKLLNLSKNNLIATPVPIMCYFVKSNLLGLNLSYNNIKHVTNCRTGEIKKLWLEGNPVCEDYTPLNYVKQVATKFPSIKELDGIPINQYGVIFPFWRNYVPDCDRKLKMLVEKFVTLYFSHYDTSRKLLDAFYADCAKFSLSTSFTAAEEGKLQHYYAHARNVMHVIKKKYVATGTKLYSSKMSIIGVLMSLLKTCHDPTTFTVDVAKYETGSVMVVIGGVFKEPATGGGHLENIYHFCRSFILAPVPPGYAENYQVPTTAALYCITNEMFTVSFASQQMKDNSFQIPVANRNTYALMNPSSAEMDTFVSMLSFCTKLKPIEAERRLKRNGWDLRSALEDFNEELIKNPFIMNHLDLEDDDDDFLQNGDGKRKYSINDIDD